MPAEPLRVVSAHMSEIGRGYYEGSARLSDGRTIVFDGVGMRPGIDARTIARLRGDELAAFVKLATRIIE